jgi:hypothetical protein
MSMSWTRRIAAGAFAAGLASVGVVAVPGAASAAPKHHGHQHGHHCYQAAVQANPSVTVHKSGSGAVAVVSVQHRLSGQARLTVTPGRSSSVWVKQGWGHKYFSTRKGVAYQVSVSFPSSKDGCVVGGSAATTYSVGGTSRASSGTTTADFVKASSGLATSPQQDSGVSTALLGALGVGLLGAGTVSLAVTRRRGRAGSAQS